MKSLLVWLGLFLQLLLYVIITAVAFALYVALWAVLASLVVGAVGGVVAGLYFMVAYSATSGLATVAAAMVCAGVSFFLFYGCRKVTKGPVKLTQMLVMAAKRLFVRKGEAE